MNNEKEKINGLIERLQNGDKAVFEEFYKLTSPKAYFLALKITQNEHDAEDILQESYIKALEKLDEIDISQNVMSWFCRIVANKSKDLLKSKKPLVFVDDDESFFEEIPEDKAEFSPEENLNQEELRLEVMAAIDELTSEKRACIMMMYFGEMSVKEIAESIEVPESTVKNRLYTARKDLRTKFEKSGNVLYGAALGSVIIWALQKTSVSVSAAFASSAVSANIFAEIGTSAACSAATTASATAAATATTATAATTAAATGSGIAAKVAALSVVQKVVVGVTATAVIGGGTAGVVTVVKMATYEPEQTTLAEEVTTAPFVTSENAFNELVETTASITQETSTIDAFSTLTNAATLTERSTKPVTTVKPTTTKVLTTRKLTTTQRETTTRNKTTTQRVTTTRNETTTRLVQTTRPTTTRPATTTKPTTQPTAQPTTQPTTSQPTTTQAKATVTIDIIDYDGSVADTIVLEIEAGTTLSNAYIVTAVREKGYEPMAGVYGDIDAVAESGKTYKFEAEL